MQIETELKKILKEATFSKEGNYLKISSKRREDTKKLVEDLLIKKKIKYINKKTSKSSLDALLLQKENFYIFFKPLIVKGQGGVNFEKDIATDLVNYFEDADMDKIIYKDVNDKIIYKDVIVALEKKNIINKKIKCKVIHEGGKNQRRELSWNNKKLTVSNSTGATLTDITLITPKNEKIYLSLKMSETYYILNAAIGNFFANKQTQKQLCEYFGFDGELMGGFGDEYRCDASAPRDYRNVTKNIKELLSNMYGSNLVVIHRRKENDVLVTDLRTSSADITVSGITLDSYSYANKISKITNIDPTPAGRKGGSIKMLAQINKHDYKIDFQFRGTTASDTGPKYLRPLLKRL